MSRERPILFSAPMVRAILDGRKTQTRRVVKGVPEGTTGWIFSPEHDRLWWPTDGDDYLGDGIACPYGREPGDRLWVREAWRALNRFNSHPIEVGSWVVYEADDNQGDARPAPTGRMGKLRPSIHMPRWASRITLEITDMRMQRLQDISEEDAKAEGLYPEPHPEGGDRQVWTTGGVWAADDAISAYLHLWEDINNPKGWCAEDNPHCWAANPWVWAVTFPRMA